MGIPELLVAISLCVEPGSAMTEIANIQSIEAKAEFVQEVNADDLEQTASLSSSNSSAGENPDYALGSTNKTMYDQNDLQRSFNYNRLGLQNKLREGDLVYERDQIGGIGHIGIVENMSVPSTNGSFIRTIEAVGDKVQYCFIDDTRFVEKNMTILRVNGIDYYNSAAFDFIGSQIGKPYDFSLERTNTNENSESWYCSELIYAAFLSAGLDLSAGSDYDGRCILPNQIFESYNTTQYWVTKKFITFEILSKNWSTWNLSFYNANGVGVSGEYNMKMANESDARNWQNLADTTPFYISSYGTLNDIHINENWFATHIAVSFTLDGLRYITAANNIQTGVQPSYWFSYQWVN